MMGIVHAAGAVSVAASDATLVLGVRSGDRDAFAELYDRRARLIRAVCWDQTRDRDVAADLTQEVFLRAYRNLNSLRDPQKFTLWLTGIARQVCREWRRSRRRERSRLERYTHLPTTGSSEPAADFEAAEELAAITTPGAPALQALDERQRLAVHAYYLSGCDVHEARTILGLSRATFYRVLSAACGKLRAALTSEQVRR
jgi:RNA polymerase sigma factor (sigma-70 family)